MWRLGLNRQAKIAARTYPRRGNCSPSAGFRGGVSGGRFPTSSANRIHLVRGSISANRTLCNWRELRELVPALKLGSCWNKSRYGASSSSAIPRGDSHGVGLCVRSLREVGHTNSEGRSRSRSSCSTDVLREGSGRRLRRMDFESRDLYRKRLSDIAEHSDCSEIEVARQSWRWPRRPIAEPTMSRGLRCENRMWGITCWAKGERLLHERVGFRAARGCRSLRAWLRRHPDEFFLPGIAIFTLRSSSAVVLFLTDRPQLAGSDFRSRC